MCFTCASAGLDCRGRAANISSIRPLGLTVDLTHGVLVGVMMCHDVITRAVLNVRDVEKLLHSEGPA